MASNSKHVIKSCKTSATGAIALLTVGLFMWKRGIPWRWGTLTYLPEVRKSLSSHATQGSMGWGPKCKHAAAKHAQLVFCFLSLSRLSFFSLQCHCCSHPHQPDYPNPRLSLSLVLAISSAFWQFWGWPHSQPVCSAVIFGGLWHSDLISLLGGVPHSAGGYPDQLTR